jgi:hypothetical protein
MIPKPVLERFNILAEAYRRRKWEVPELPGNMYEAANVVRQMAAKLTGRPPLRVVYDDTPSVQVDE